MLVLPIRLALTISLTLCHSADAIASAGISNKIDKGLNIQGIDQTQLSLNDRFIKGIAQSTSKSLLQGASMAVRTAEEVVRWNAVYDKFTPYSNRYKDLVKIYGDDINNIQKRLDSGELVLDKTLADYIYQMNTNKNLVIYMTLQRDVDVIIAGKENNWRDNQSVPDEEINNA